MQYKLTIANRSNTVIQKLLKSYKTLDVMFVFCWLHFTILDICLDIYNVFFYILKNFFSLLFVFLNIFFNYFLQPIRYKISYSNHISPKILNDKFLNYLRKTKIIIQGNDEQLLLFH